MKTFLADESGATSIEYALIAGAIFMAIVTTLASIGPLLEAKYAAILPGLQR
jgi:pilus assembly protein Flp/PilA